MRLIEQVRAMPREISSLPFTVKAISFTVFIYYISWGLVSPFLSIFFYDLLGTYKYATFIGALPFLFGILWMFPVGELLDRFSQKDVLRAALLLYLPLWPFLALLQTLFQAIIFQLHHSIAATAFWSSAETYTRSNSPKGRRSSSWGLFDIGATLGLILGAIIGGFMLQQIFNDMRTLFWVLPPFFIITTFIITKKLPEKTKEVPGSFLKDLKDIEWKKMYRKEIADFWAIRDLRRIWVFIILTGFLTVTQGVLLPLLADEVGASFVEIGFMYALFLVPLLLEAPFSVLADKWSSRALMVVGSSAAALALWGVTVATHPFILFPLALQIGVALAMMKPTVAGAATNAMPAGHTGELNAVSSASFGLGGVLGLLFMGPIADSAGIHVTFLISAIIMVFCGIFAVLAWKDPSARFKNANLVSDNY